MFSKGKKKAIKSKRVKNYTRYAIGEILLIVIGILVAFGLKNWNNGLQQEKIREDIYVTIYNDLKRDTLELNDKIDYYENTEQFYWTVSECKMDKKEIEDCLGCIAIGGQERTFRMDKNGFQKLKSYSNASEVSKNNLDFDVINFYSSSEVGQL